MARTKKKTAEHKNLLGEVVKNARKSKGLTRDTFSSMIKKSPRYIAAIENEGQYPAYETLLSIVRTLGIDPNLIFYPEDEAQTDKISRVVRLVKLCNDKELSVVAATVEALVIDREDAIL